MSMHEEMNNSGVEVNEGMGADFETSEETYYSRPSIDLSFLRAETGAGDISEYVYHPLNFNKSAGMGRIIRGLTGMFGSLNFAIADICIGIFDLTSKKKHQGVVNDVEHIRYNGDIS